MHCTVRSASSGWRVRYRNGLWGSTAHALQMRAVRSSLQPRGSREHRWNMLTTNPCRFLATKNAAHEGGVFASIDDSLTGYLLFVLFIAENCWVR